MRLFNIRIHTCLCIVTRIVRIKNTYNLHSNFEFVSVFRRWIQFHNCYWIPSWMNCGFSRYATILDANWNQFFPQNRAYKTYEPMIFICRHRSYRRKLLHKLWLLLPYCLILKIVEIDCWFFLILSVYELQLLFLSTVPHTLFTYLQFFILLHRIVNHTQETTFVCLYPKKKNISTTLCLMLGYSNTPNTRYTLKCNISDSSQTFFEKKFAKPDWNYFYK